MRRPPAAVAAGNVETSSRIVDVVMHAFGEAIAVPAQGQGTMNNVTLGNERFTYYETIGGGQGACPDADGPSGVHVAMSNTLSTPVEALELQYPMRVERYALRPGSGGAGHTAAATASSASCACSRIAASRSSANGAHTLRRARAAARRGRPAATCSTASRCRRS